MALVSADPGAPGDVAIPSMVRDNSPPMAASRNHPDADHLFAQQIQSEIASRISKCLPCCPDTRRFGIACSGLARRPRRAVARPTRHNPGPSVPVPSIQDGIAPTTPIVRHRGVLLFTPTESPWHRRCLFHQQACCAARCQGVRPKQASRVVNDRPASIWCRKRATDREEASIGIGTAVG